MLDPALGKRWSVAFRWRAARIGRSAIRRATRIDFIAVYALASANVQASIPEGMTRRTPAPDAAQAADLR